MTDPDDSRTPRRPLVLGGFAGLFAAVVSACTGEPDQAPSSAMGGLSTTSPTGSTAPTNATASPSATTPTATTPPDGLAGGGHVNVLVLGTDSRSKTSFAGQSDVITLVQLSADRTRINLVSIARDTYVSLPGGGSGKINAAYARGGAAAMRGSVTALLGVPVHATLETSFQRFIAIVDRLGGVGVDNRFASSSSGVRFPKGRFTISGPTALVYVRERKGLPNGDLDRTERHRATLTGMVERLAQLAQRPAALEALVPVLMTQVRANGLTAAQAAKLIPVVARLSREDVSSVMVPIAAFDMIGGASVDLVNKKRTAELRAALAAGDLRPYVAKYGTSNATTG